MVLQDYGQAPAHQNPIAYTAVGLPTKPGNVFDRAPTTADIDYPLGFEWLYQVDAGTSNIYCRVPDSTVWQLLEGSASGVIPVDNGGTGRNTLTDHAIIIGSGTSPVDFVGPGASGTVLQGGGGSADPAFSTATYPSVATSAGTFLRADGTNWLASTATLPNTAAQGDLLYASAADTWISLAKSSTPGQVLTNNGTSNGPAWAPADGGTATGWSNLGISLSAGVLSIVSESGAVISSSNPALIKIQSKATPGVIKSIALTAAPVGLTASELTSATFGTTAATAWAPAMPFFIYAVINSAETAISFFCSRNPCAVNSPATVYKASTVASVTDKSAFFGFDSAATSADYASSPCVRVGSFRMVKSAGDAWTIQTLGSGNGGVGDGIGNYGENTYWVFPTGQNGANAGGYFSNADASDPAIVLSTGGYTYQLGNDGSCDIFMSFTTTDDGSGAVDLRYHVPYDTNAEANISSPPGYFRFTTTSGGVQNIFMALRNNVSSGDPAWYTLARISDGTFLTGADFVATGTPVTGISNISADFTYQAFGN